LASRLPLETQTLYAELLEHLIGVSAHRSVGRLAGTFTTKHVKNDLYLYFQASLPGGQTKQFYVGRKTPALDRLVKRFETEQATFAPDIARVRRLSAQLRAGGAQTTDAPSARVIGALAAAGVFDAGGVLVGTHAFVVLGNLLGVRWSSGGLRTQDVDVGTARKLDLDIAVPDIEADVPAVLDSLAMGFLPVPPLNPKLPSTSFKVRGQALRVDLLCPRRGAEESPVFIPRFNAAAQPLDYLDLLLESPERAVALGATAAMVNVPSPARFALHKLLIANLRPAAMQAKARKDLAQASALLEVLIEDRPGDLGVAWKAIADRGARFIRAARTGVRALERHNPELHGRLTELLAG
jgi:hypothetical protein